MKRILSIFIIVWLLAGCAPSESAIKTAIAQTQAAAAALATATQPAAATLAPTSTTAPTNTLAPTNTAAPTNTPAPTKTSVPTNTPTTAPSPTPPPQPVELSGKGNKIVDFENTFGVAFVHIIYKGSRYFSVKNLDSNNEGIDLLVNTVGSYDGKRPLDWRNDQHTVRFEIKSSGDWTITVYPVAKQYLHICQVPGECTGNGDDVLIFEGKTPDIMEYDFKGDRYSSIKSYTTNDYDLLVNDTGSLQGSTVIPAGSFILEVVTVGDWTLKFTGK
jgi:hypothetical protein